MLLRLRTLFRRNTVEQELADEVRFHLEQQIAENQAAGMSAAEARHAALREFGGVEQLKEECREARRVNRLETLLSDLRYGLRTLRKSPGFAGLSVLTLALGIGANTAIFSMVNALLLHPYNFRELDSLLRVWENRGIDEGFDARFIAPADAEDLRSAAQSFLSVTTYQFSDFNLSTEGNVESVLGCRVSANFFDILGVTPASGRVFSSSEEQPGADGVAIVGRGLWQGRFGGDPNLIGKTISLNGRVYSVVGIMPKDFSFPVPAELWVPLALTPAEKSDRAQLTLNALARLKPGTNVQQARAALAGFSQGLSRDFPKTNSGRVTTILPLRKELYLYTLPLFLLLQAAAVVVLLLACANLANLVFARMIGRQREIAVRSALGAGRGRLAQLFISETLVLSGVAGLVSIAASLISVRALRTSIPVSWTRWVPGWDGIQVDRSVLAFTLLLAAVVGIFFGLVTVLHTSSIDLNQTLKESAKGSLSRAKSRLRAALVVAQVVFALVLLVCAGLTIQGFTRLANVYQGFEPASVLRVELSLPKKTYSDNVRITNFYEEVLQAASSLPGVAHASLITNPPASNVDSETTFFAIEGQRPLKMSEMPSADLQTTSSDFFTTLKVGLVAGRTLADSDKSEALPVAVVSRNMAKRFWPGGDALGSRIRLGSQDSAEPWMTIVGIVGDMRQNWWNPAARPVIYRPFAQAPQQSMVLLLRTASNPTNFTAPVREILRKLDPGIALNGASTLESEVADSIAIIRILGILMGVFGLVALSLSSVGVYGVLSESVAQRTQEIGIRLALGADPRGVMKMILRQALTLTAVGLAFALPLSFAIGRAMGNLIYGVVALNYAVLLGFAVLLLFVAVIAGYVPARRAMRVDPLLSLRYE